MANLSSFPPKRSASLSSQISQPKDKNIKRSWQFNICENGEIFLSPDFLSHMQLNCGDSLLCIQEDDYLILKKINGSSIKLSDIVK